MAEAQFYSVDHKQRLMAAEKIHEVFSKLIEQIKEGKNPTLAIQYTMLKENSYSLAPNFKKEDFLT